MNALTLLPEVKLVAEPTPRRKAAAGPTPLLPVAVAATTGIIIDYYLAPPLIISAALAVALFTFWVMALFQQRPPNAVALWLIAACLSGAWHQLRQAPYPNDISHYADDEGKLIRGRGVVLEKPTSRKFGSPELRSRRGEEHTVTTVEMSQTAVGDKWVSIRGTVRLSVYGNPELRIGDEIQFVGEIRNLPAPNNPGEMDFREHSRKQGIRAVVTVKAAEAVTLLPSNGTRSFAVRMATFRDWCADSLKSALDNREHIELAIALLLGDQSSLDREELDRYVRTGVVHVLAISGQHLLILCGIFTFHVVGFQPFWLTGMNRRRSAFVLFGFVVCYAALTGAHPPVVRAAVMVCTWCLGVILRRRSPFLNSLAFAWLVILIANPADVFQYGCWLSFLSVLDLFQVVARWQAVRAASLDGIEVLIEESRPHFVRLVRRTAIRYFWATVASSVIWLALAPLLARQNHVVSPIVILLSPIVSICVSFALVAGFFAIVLTPLGPFFTKIPAFIVEQSLTAVSGLTTMGDNLPGGYWYVCGLPDWSIWVFYLSLLTFLLNRWMLDYWKWGLIAAGLWLLVVLAVVGAKHDRDGFRCTVLSVGHGSCAVLESPDGRVFLFDAGSMAGPEVTTRLIAPFLWHRGITQVDEVFLSHADLDHFNGLPALLERFAVAKISLTPSFREREHPGVTKVKKDIDARGVPVRILKTGDRLQAGEVDLFVHHPPAVGPGGVENARSMVLSVSYFGRTIFFTGDLQEPGLSMVMRQPPPPIDVLIAPHHGSPTSNTDAFARWAKAKLIISSEGRPQGRRPDPYNSMGGELWRTWEVGAVTVTVHNGEMFAETFRRRDDGVARMSVP